MIMPVVQSGCMFEILAQNLLCERVNCVKTHIGCNLQPVTHALTCTNIINYEQLL